MGAWVVPGYVEARELGAGGSGRVVLATHEATGMPVAVKYLSERFRSDEAFVRGFRSEARLLGALDSPYVVGFYEYVEAPRGAAIVMELVDGVALRALIAREGSTGPEAALVVLKGSLLGLAAAHRAGVVHRDYKPENVLVAVDGSSKLVDFGIAAGRGATPGVAGTPGYMAPEQWNGAPASPAADVYAATATFFECLTGRKPFSGDNFAELALHHLDSPVPDGQAPEPLRPLIRRGLAKSPHERPENAAAFVTELESVATAAYGPDWEERGRGRLAALAALLPLLLPSSGGGGASEGTTVLATTTLPAPPPRPRWRIPRGVPAGAAALVLALLLALAARAGVEATNGDEAAQAFATTSTGPGTASPGPSTSPLSPSSPGPELPPTAPPSASASSGSTGPSATPAGSSTDGTTAAPTTATPPTSSSGSASPTASTPTPASTSTSTGTPATTPAETPPTTTAAPSPVAVTAVSVTSLRQTGPTTASGAVEVTTDGTGPVTIHVEWFTGDEKGAPGTPDGSETYQREGATRYTLALAHDVRGAGCYWGLRVTTYPAAANGGSLQQIFIRRCTIS
ncbi:serine/threonine-protein kinase [Streptomyces sp. SJL17-4]|uniref:serine/threonine-protein kinase n=1 Tax=Streptomyces sp. SJL17-4 TaxID=2967224 RepID=UPI0030D24384